jgi:hypothetical protein
LIDDMDELKPIAGGNQAEPEANEIGVRLSAALHVPAV